MHKYPKFLVLYSLIITLTGFLAACGSVSNRVSATNHTGAVSTASTVNIASPTDIASQHASTNKVNSTWPQVHMKDMDFLQSSITIKKGESITLVSDTPTPHQITNGSWSRGGSAQPANEAGAPRVNVTVPGDSQQTIGPFMTAGTFHYYCTIHQGMNLTVVVQP